MSDWILLKYTRLKLIKYCNLIALPTLVFIFWHTIIGKLENEAMTAWTWFMLLVLPGIVLINFSLMLHKNMERIVPVSLHKFLIYFAIFYYIFILITYLSLQMAIDSLDIGIGDYLRKTYIFLLPLNLLFAIGIVAVFYKKDPLFKPSARVLLGIAREKATQPSRQTNLLQQQVFQLIADNRMEEVFHVLKNALAHTEPDLFDHAILLNNQYSQITTQKDLGIVDPEFAQQTLNKITFSLINLTDKMPGTSI